MLFALAGDSTMTSFANFDPTFLFADSYQTEHDAMPLSEGEDFAGLLKHPTFQFQQCQRRSHIGGVFRNGFDQRVCVERRAGQQGAEPVLERAGRVGGSRQRFRSRCFGGFPGRLRVRRAVLIAVI